MKTLPSIVLTFAVLAAVAFTAGAVTIGASLVTASVLVIGFGEYARPQRVLIPVESQVSVPAESHKLPLAA